VEEAGRSIPVAKRRGEGANGARRAQKEMCKSSNETSKTRNQAPDFENRATFGRLRRDPITMAWWWLADAQEIW
jgi:hypothetical protein